MSKLTLSGRDFYIQTIAGLVKYPSGVGYGNFEVISSDESTHWFKRNDFSVLTHNLPLEWIAGMGWFGLVGFVWLGLVTWRMGEIPSSNSPGKTIMWRAVYWGLLINFLLDTTYFVPSMWWLFMVVMGLGEERE